jgi:D-alanyl-D-alanine carboxypeptidase
VPEYLIKGTTANLHPRDLLSLKELLYAMLLPSGNDAAIAIANWGGE